MAPWLNEKTTLISSKERARLALVVNLVLSVTIIAILVVGVSNLSPTPGSILTIPKMAGKLDHPWQLK